MKNILFSSVVLALVFVGCASDGKSVGTQKSTKSTQKMMMFQSVPVDKATILQSGKDKMHCVKCGMVLPKFYKTNHAAKVNGVQKQYCSIHCVVDEQNQGNKPSDIKVVDTNTLKFIDAKSAWYVVGSNKKGTMSPVSKYAFLDKIKAEEFAKVNGGKVMSFDEALEVAKKDFTPEGQKWLSQMKAKKAKMMKMKAMMPK